MLRSLSLLATGLLTLAGSSIAIKVDVNDAQSISDAAKTVVDHIVSLYDGKDSSGIPGLLPPPYYWWESGLAHDSLINYWFLTGDGTHNDLVTQGLLWQLSETENFMPPNQTKSLGNDDQSTWAHACMTAAERGFPDPPSNSGIDSWLQAAQNVFDNQVERWDTDHCDGGLRWQIYPFNNGYDYKNTLSNGNFLHLAARLAHYTGNQTFTDWATKITEWSEDAGLVSSKGAVFDGVSVNGCKPNHIQWTANFGIYLSAYAYMGVGTYSNHFGGYKLTCMQL